MTALMTALLMNLAFASAFAFSNTPSADDGTETRPLVEAHPFTAAAPNCPIAFPKANLCASLHWNDAPVVGREGKLTLKFWNPAQGTAAGPFRDVPDTLGVVLWMEMGGGHGHGSAPTRITKKEPGIYSVTNLHFVMPGSWEIRIQRKSGASLAEQAMVPVQVQ